MELQSLLESLAGLGIEAIRYFDSIDSTNHEAAQWAEAGTPDLSLVVADEQTQGRGRAGRQWFTPAGCALAFSLVLRFPGSAQSNGMFALLAGLGALAVSDALLEYNLPIEIKWPNDVLIRRRKVAGILVEAFWQGEQIKAAVLGIGVNVAPQSVPPAHELNYPATCVEAEVGRKIERLRLLRSIIYQLLVRKDDLLTDQFLQDWNNQLAFRGDWVQVHEQGTIIEGQVIGLNEDGSLKLATGIGQSISIYTGDLRLRIKD